MWETITRSDNLNRLKHKGIKIRKILTSGEKIYIFLSTLRGAWRGARVVESGGLENRCAFTGTVGSNPTLSASSRLVL